MALNDVKPSPVWRRHSGLALVVAIFLALATVYSVATPIFEASDEIWHYPYVKLIAEGQGLPVQKPHAEENIARQEGSQPPLYYALSALATFWIDTGDFDSLAWVNPHAKVGDPLAYGNKNMAIHTFRDGFPFQGPALAVHLIRWLSILLGAITIVCVYATVREVLPSRREVALGAAALVAFNPEFAFISASVTNDNLIIALGSLAVLMLIRFVKSGITLEQSFALGLVLGLGLLAKLTALGLIPIIFASVALISYRRRSLAHFLSRTAVIAVVSTAIAAWWYVRNWQLYGDPMGLSMMLKIVNVRDPMPGLFDLFAEFEGFRISFWGLFGAVNIIADSWVYKVLDGVVVLAVLGLVVAAIARFIGWNTSPLRRRMYSEPALRAPQKTVARGLVPPPPCGGQAPALRQSEASTDLLRRVGREPRRWLAATLEHNPKSVPSGIVMLIPTLWLLIVFALFVKWTQTTLGSQGRLVFPALSGIALLLSLGLASLAPRRLSWAPLAIVATFLLAFSALTPIRYISPSYTQPPILSEKAVPSGIQTANVSFGGKMRLIGYDLDKQQVKPGDEVKLTLYWQALAEMNEDYSIFVHLVGRGNRAVAQEDSYPGLGAYPTRRWRFGDVIGEEHRLVISPAAEAPSLVRLVVGMYTLSDMKRLTAYDDKQRSLGDSHVLGDLKLASTSPEPKPAHPLAKANFGDVVELAGYDLGEATVKPGDDLKLTLYWRAERRIAENYTVFTQLLSPQDTIYGQHDRPPANGEYPTRLWDKGELIADEHHIKVQTDAPPGKYRLIAGMYLPATNQRLTLADPPNLSYFVVSEVTVAPPS